jgi:hypothetical protein
VPKFEVGDRVRVNYRPKYYATLTKPWSATGVVVKHGITMYYVELDAPVTEYPLQELWCSVDELTVAP